MFGMKEVGAADATQRAQRSPQVLVIARGQDAAASLTETCDSLAICLRQTIAGINRKQPELVELRSIQRAENAIVTCGVRFAIASYHLKQWVSGFVFPRGQFIPQQ